ncbi:MAG: outer membrane protein assembly factor BamA [Bacteroidales bacterium]|jgi:outer membrane protein insertion porin family|nr:outer membrane protein assembly factor BamA [Bacteroidales bacterium]
MRRLLISFLLCALSATAFAQLDKSADFTVDYSSNQKYTIAGIDIQGIRYLDKDILLQYSGLAPGQEFSFSDNLIQNAIKKLWNNQMFSDIKVEASKIEGDKIWLVIFLQERPRLTDFTYYGVSKNDIKDIKDKVIFIPGQQVTESQLNNAQRLIKDILHEKGFLNTEVAIVQRDDPEHPNQVILDIKIDKKEKVKVQNIVFHGNENLNSVKLDRAMKKTNGRNILNFFRTKKFLENKFRDDKMNVIAKYNEKGYRDATITADSVTPLPNGRVRIDLWVEEGNKYYIGDIRWMGNTVYKSEDLSRELGIKKGDVFDQKLLDKRLTEDESAVSSLYLDHGYLFFSVNPVEVRVENDTIDFEMRIREGQQATINEVGVKGNTKTNEHVIRRELRVEPGELFSKSNVIRSVRELSNLSLFDPEHINPKVLPNPDNGTVDMDFEVEEKSNDQVELSGGWGANMFVGSLGFRFSNFSIRNMFNKSAWRPLPSGDGQTLSLRAQTSGKFYQNYSISFIEPWLGGKKPNSLTVSLSFSRVNYSANSYYGSSGYNPYSYGYGYGYGYGYNDYYSNYGYYNTYDTNSDDDQIQMTFALALGYGYRLKWPDDYFTMYHELSLEHYSLKNMANYYYFLNDGAQASGSGEFNNINFKTAFGRNSVSNPLYPRGGSEISLTLEATPPYSLINGKNYESQKMTNQEKYRFIEYHKWKFKGDWYIPLNFSSLRHQLNEKSNKLILHTKFEYGFLGYYNNNLRSPFQRFRVGGSGMSGYNLYGADIISLRGYEDYSLSPTYGSNLYDKLSLELRFPVALQPQATVYVLAFMDAGNAWMNFRDFDPFDLKRSAGIGARVFLPMFGLLGIDWGYGFDEIAGNPGAGGSQLHFVIGQQF